MIVAVVHTIAVTMAMTPITIRAIVHDGNLHSVEIRKRKE